MIAPYFKALANIIPKMQEMSNNVSSNTEEYKKLTEEYQIEMEKGNPKF